MAKWHLMTPLATSERTCEAESEFWAKRRFAPIPRGWFVASDASYRLGWVKSDVPPMCTKCNRHPITDGKSKCETCRGYHRKQVARASERNRIEDRSRTAKIQRQRRKREKHVWQENVRQSNIKRGIELRAAKRTAQLTLSL